MSHTRLWIAATIIAFLIVVSFVFSVPHTRDVVRESAPQSVTTVPLVTLRDVFKKGLHTITGSVEAPNACSIVTAQANLQGDASSTQSIQIALSMPVDTNVCLQLPTRMNFSTTITAPAQIPITATVNGLVATTTSS